MNAHGYKKPVALQILQALVWQHFQKEKNLCNDQLEFLLFSTESKWKIGAEFIAFPFSLQVYMLFYNTPFVGRVVSSIFVLIK